MKSKKTTGLIFEPFVRFVIEFHNQMELYVRILQNELEDNVKLQEQEVGLLYEAFLIKVTAEWELFLHNILAYCVALDTSAISNYLQLELPAKLSFDNSFAILNGLDFISITSVSELKNMVKKILSDRYNPFKAFETNFLNTIDEMYTLRNYIAHKSTRSKIRLGKMYKDRHQISIFKTPGEFLTTKSTFRGNEMTIFQDYLGTLLCIAVEIWKILDPASYLFVYEDDSTEEGLFIGMAKMRLVFDRLTIENGL
jgi:hypothetical protein